MDFKFLDVIERDIDMIIRYIYSLESYMDEMGLHISCEVALMTGDNSNVCFEILCDELTVKWDEFFGKPWYYSRKDKLR